MTRALLKYLLKPLAYPEPTNRVMYIQTHISHIFLTDSFAYKIKKPVDFGFLNFSTIDRRRFYCNEEVRLNRRLAPEVYLGVIELRQTEHGPSFYGEGPIIDYAVKMKRLPAECMLDKLVHSGRADESVIRRVADIIAEFHSTTPTSPAVAEYGQPERIRYNWQENFDQMLQFEQETLPEADRCSIQKFIAGYIEDKYHLFQKRVEDGFIRECDGDIHLENICIEGDNIHIFDCIEFNERFRCCDTAADIAFLLMDLDYNNHHGLAEIACEQYIKTSGDSIAPQLIVFYQIYRAFIRGKVESFLLRDLEIEAEQREKATNRAIRYFRLARGYIERLRQPLTLYITCGLMGCGKSTLAHALAFELGIRLFRSDAIRKELHGLTADVPVKVAYASNIYDPAASEATYSALLQLAETEIHNNRSVIIDASFMLQRQREMFFTLAEQLGIRFLILYVHCKPAENRRRLQNRASQSDISDGRPDLLQTQTTHFESPQDSDKCIISLDSKYPPEILINTIYDRYRQC